MPEKGEWTRGTAVAVIGRDAAGAATGGAWAPLGGGQARAYGLDSLDEMVLELADWPTVLVWDREPELRGLGAKRTVPLAPEIGAALRRRDELARRRSGRSTPARRGVRFDQVVGSTLGIGPAPAGAVRERVQQLRGLWRTGLSPTGVLLADGDGGPEEVGGLPRIWRSGRGAPPRRRGR